MQVTHGNTTIIEDWFPTDIEFERAWWWSFYETSLDSGGCCCS